MNNAEELFQHLSQLDGQSYGAYRSLSKQVRFSHFELTFEYIQGDPFASPSLLSVSIPCSSTLVPVHLVSSSARQIACADYLARVFRSNIHSQDFGVQGSGGSGRISIDAGGQEVLERTCLTIHPETLRCRFYLGLPAQGRRILGRQAQRLLLESLPKLVRDSFFGEALDLTALEQHVQCVEDQETLRGQLAARHLVAFIANGSVLPRRSGVDSRPLDGADCIPFQSPPSLQVELETTHSGPICGMGIPAGVSLIVGGGFHGKSTLLRAIETGIYNHVPGDGREAVVTVSSAAKIRAEDGRSIRNVDISPFINHLPSDLDTHHFTTENASGSTSQAANIVEALELGCDLLLIDEDTSATNFIIRDARMQALVSQVGEPITPLIDQIQALHRQLGVSSILVMGGSGDYFDVADRVIRMNSYRPLDVTEEALQVAKRYPSQRSQEDIPSLPEHWERYPKTRSFDPSRGRRDVKIDARGLQKILFGRTEIDLSAIEQLVDVSQTRAIGLAIEFLSQSFFQKGVSLAEALRGLDQLLDEQGLDCLSSMVYGNLARPRPLEIGAALNRLRTLEVGE